MYQDEHAIAKINGDTDSMTNSKIDNRSKTSDKNSQNKTNKTIHFGVTARNVVNLATQQKECRNNLTTASQDQIPNGPTNIQTT